MRLRGIRGGVLLTLDAKSSADELGPALAPHAAVLGGKVVLEVAEKVPVAVVLAAIAQVAACGGEVTELRPPTVVTAARAETVIVARTVRSGGRVESAGSLVVLGDVNAGSELVAEGDVIVTGVLRGVAHAGAAGNEKALIYAERILAPQLRIAGVLAQGTERADGAGDGKGDGDEGRRSKEVAFVREGQIVVRPWST